MAILSNSAGSKDDTGFEEAKHIEQAMDIHVIKHPIKKKPFVWDELQEHFGRG